MSPSPKVKRIDIWLANFKDIPDIYQGALPGCTYVSHPTDALVMESTYPAQGMTVTDSTGQSKTFWTVAVVVDETGKPKIFYQYSDFIIRNTTIDGFSPCTQGLFISDERDILDFKSNEPYVGLGKALLNGETIEMSCQAK